MHAFSAQALAACEALIHPRCPPTWPAFTSMQQPPKNGKTATASEYLGMPRMWSPSMMDAGKHVAPPSWNVLQALTHGSISFAQFLAKEHDQG